MGCLNCRPGRIWAALLVAGIAPACDRVCLGKTPVVRVDCSASGGATAHWSSGTPDPVEVQLEYADAPVTIGRYYFVLDSTDLQAGITIPPLSGPRTFALPSPEVTVAASLHRSAPSCKPAWPSIWLAAAGRPSN